MIIHILNFVFLFTVYLSAYSQSSALALPEGPYQDKCKECTYDGTLITCNCPVCTLQMETITDARDIYKSCFGLFGYSRKISLRVNNDKKQIIDAKNSGQLVLNMPRGLMDENSLKVSSQIADNCKDCIYDGSNLNCYCQNLEGNYKETSIQISHISELANLINIDGELENAKDYSAQAWQNTKYELMHQMLLFTAIFTTFTIPVLVCSLIKKRILAAQSMHRCEISILCATTFSPCPLPR